MSDNDLMCASMPASINLFDSFWEVVSPSSSEAPQYVEWANLESVQCDDAGNQCVYTYEDPKVVNLSSLSKGSASWSLNWLWSAMGDVKKTQDQDPDPDVCTLKSVDCGPVEDEWAFLAQNPNLLGKTNPVP